MHLAVSVKSLTMGSVLERGEKQVLREIPINIRRDIALHIRYTLSQVSHCRLYEFFFFFFLNCTSRGTNVHSGTPGP